MMDTLIKILAAGACLFLVWMLYKQIQSNPEMLSKKNINKSFSTMGILALILIGAVTLMVFMLKHS
ncbi:MAG: hypothetical protein HYX61_00615 [Gammaproteobacteria bacterium]|nr:hypothetical protein [Gammaproteobacteria bacterium]